MTPTPETPKREVTIMGERATVPDVLRFMFDEEDGELELDHPGATPAFSKIEGLWCFNKKIEAIMFCEAAIAYYMRKAQTLNDQHTMKCADYRAAVANKKAWLRILEKVEAGR